MTKRILNQTWRQHVVNVREKGHFKHFIPIRIEAVGTEGALGAQST